MPTDYPFLYFGHASSEYSIVDVCVWFEREPTAPERAIITRALTEGHAFWNRPPSDDVVWSGRVASYTNVLDHERKHLTVKDARIAAALAQCEPALYQTTKKAMKPVPFALHLIIDQALVALNERFPIAFAVRQQGPRDKLSAWHDFSLQRRSAAMQQVADLVSTSPPNFSTRRAFQWLAPWLHAATSVARACTEKRFLAKLDPAEKTVLADFFLEVSAHAEPQPDWADNTAAFAGVTECRDTLLALADKLGGVRTTLSNASEVLTQILKEAQQFEFTRVKLGECPTFERTKLDEVLRFEVAIAATEQILRDLETLSGNKPGATGLTFSASDQQRLQVLEKVTSQLLRRKGTFNHTQALAMLKVLSTSIRPLGAWLPAQLIAEKLQNFLTTHGRSPEFDAALTTLLELPYPLNRDSHEVRGFFEALATG